MRKLAASALVALSSLLLAPAAMAQVQTGADCTFSGPVSPVIVNAVDTAPTPEALADAVRIALLEDPSLAADVVALLNSGAGLSDAQRGALAATLAQALLLLEVDQPQAAVQLASVVDCAGPDIRQRIAEIRRSFYVVTRGGARVLVARVFGLGFGGGLVSPN